MGPILKFCEFELADDAPIPPKTPSDPKDWACAFDDEDPKLLRPKWLLLANALPSPLKLFEFAPTLDDELSGPPKLLKWKRV